MRSLMNTSRFSWLATAMLALVLSFSFTEEAEAACCTGTECTDDNLILCALKGGNWSIGPCIPFVTCALTGDQGACCALGSLANICLPSTEGLCLDGNNFYSGASCDQLDCRRPPPKGACCSIFGQCSVTLEENCDSFGSSWVQGATCDDGICGIGGAQGACCPAIGDTCLEVPSALCIGGQFNTGKTCSAVQCGPPPPPPTGACCSGGQCITTTEEQCNLNRGIFSSQANCEIADLCTIPEPKGVCCMADTGVCADVNNASQCVAGNFVQDQTCSSYSCPVVTLPEGACCVGGQCSKQTQAACNTMGGVYKGDNSVCGADTCPLPPSPGACCLVGGGCREGVQTDCQTGTWHKDESCQTLGLCVQPDPEVGCCLPSGCTTLTESACRSAQGTVTGAICDASQCQPVGSCCENYTCSQKKQNECTGTFVVGGVCDANTCPAPPPTGGCCLQSGVCEDVVESECLRVGGNWTPAICGVRPSCAQPDPVGACCEAGVGCTSTSKSSCTDGVFSEGLTCAEVSCVVDAQGSCCAGANCHEVTESACIGLTGVFTEGGSCGDLAAVCPSAERGSCCVNGTCSNVSRFECEAGNGVFELGGDCAVQNICEPELRGNCCAGNACSYITEAECLALAGEFLGTETCDAVVCGNAPVLGACCHKGQCSTVEADACEGQWTETVACDVIECEPYEPTFGGGSVFGRCSQASMTWASTMMSMLAMLALVVLRRRREV